MGLTPSTIADLTIRLSPSTSSEVLVWLAQAKIEAGLVGSGTRVISSYIVTDVLWADARDGLFASEVEPQVYGQRHPQKAWRFWRMAK